MTEQLIQMFFGSFTAVLPAHWADMENSLFKQVSLPSDSDEYKEVEQKLKSKSCSLNILKVGGSALRSFITAGQRASTASEWMTSCCVGFCRSNGSRMRCCGRRTRC